MSCKSILQSTYLRPEFSAVSGNHELPYGETCRRHSISLSRDERHDPKLNYFGINASNPLSYWRKKGWIYPDDPRGWFQWYCRYYMGRRLGEEDRRQIARWKAIKRHIAQVYKHCSAGDMNCRPKQRQAVMHWAYNSRIM